MHHNTQAATEVVLTGKTSPGSAASPPLCSCHGCQRCTCSGDGPNGKSKLAQTCLVRQAAGHGTVPAGWQAGPCTRQRKQGLGRDMQLCCAGRQADRQAQATAAGGSGGRGAPGAAQPRHRHQHCTRSSSGAAACAVPASTGWQGSSSWRQWGSRGPRGSPTTPPPPAADRRLGAWG